MPTLVEILIIVLICLLVFTAGHLTAIADALARLVHGEATRGDEEGSEEARDEEPA